MFRLIRTTLSVIAFTTMVVSVAPTLSAHEQDVVKRVTTIPAKSPIPTGWYTWPAEEKNRYLRALKNEDVIALMTAITVDPDKVFESPEAIVTRLKFFGSPSPVLSLVSTPVVVVINPILNDVAGGQFSYLTSYDLSGNGRNITAQFLVSPLLSTNTTDAVAELTADANTWISGLGDTISKIWFTSYPDLPWYTTAEQSKLAGIPSNIGSLVSTAQGTANTAQTDAATAQSTANAKVASVSAGTNITITGTATAPIVNASGGYAPGGSCSVSHGIATVNTQTNQSFQVSTSGTLPVRGSYYFSLSSTTSIGGPSLVDVLLEEASTNSSTAGAWTEKARIGQDQTATLAIVLQLVSGMRSALVFPMMDSTKWYRFRSIITGTASTSFVRGCEVW